MRGKRVTCPSQLRRRPAAAENLGDASDRPVSRVHGAPSPLLDRLRQDDGWAQFIRFVLVGGTSTGVYALFFLSLRGLGYLPAHVMATVVSSMFANELHRRLTFHAEERVGWLASQIEAGGVSFLGLVATSASLGWLDATVGSASPLLQISLVAAVTAVIGLMRFVALRWIFRPAVVETA
jgi:putative flippase GtrA